MVRTDGCSVLTVPYSAVATSHCYTVHHGGISRSPLFHTLGWRRRPALYIASAHIARPARRLRAFLSAPAGRTPLSALTMARPPRELFAAESLMED